MSTTVRSLVETRASSRSVARLAGRLRPRRCDSSTYRPVPVAKHVAAPCGLAAAQKVKNRARSDYLVASLVGLCCLLPLAGFAQNGSPEEEKKPKPALPFKKSSFAVHSAQPLNAGTVAFFGELGYPFVEAGFLYGIGGALNVGANVKSEWGLTVGGDAQVMLGLIKRRNQAIAIKGEVGFLTLGGGDPQVLAFGTGQAGLNDSPRGGLPHAFAAASNLTISPQLVYSYKDSPGTWFISGGVTIQQFLEPLPDTATQETSFMPRLSVGIERVMSPNVSFHFNTVAGVYFDANVPDAAGAPTKAFIGMAQIGLNLFLP